MWGPFRDGSVETVIHIVTVFINESHSSLWCCVCVMIWTDRYHTGDLDCVHYGVVCDDLG